MPQIGIKTNGANVLEVPAAAWVFLCHNLKKVFKSFRLADAVLGARISTRRQI
jgi:hypothetical protein